MPVIQRLLLRSAGLIVLTLTAGPATWAQISTGPFQPGATAFLNVTDGAPDPAVGETTVDLDTNADGIPDTTFPLPVEIRPVSGTSVDLTLSPTQQVLIARSFRTGSGPGPCPAAGDVQLRLYFVELSPAPQLVSFTGQQGVCVPSLAIGPRFYDVDGAPIRTLAAAAGGGTPGTPQTMIWADLVGGVVALNGSSFNANVDRIEFAPSGNAAFVTHGLSSAQPRYSLIDLCASPIASGATSQPLPPPVVSAEVVTGGATGFGAQLLVNGSPQLGTFLALDLSCFTGSDEACCFGDGVCSDMPAGDCLGMSGTPGGPGSDCQSAECPEACCTAGVCSFETPSTCSGGGGTPQGVPSNCSTVNCPPVTVACCFIDGTCAEVDAGQCASSGGTASGSTCNGVTCPVLELQVSTLLPSPIESGTEFTQEIVVENIGGIDATNVSVSTFVPSGATFRSASNGGSLSGNQVRWLLSSLPVGTQTSVTVTYQAPCFGTSLTADSTASTQGLFFSSGPVTATLDAANRAPLTGSVVAIPDNTPLQPGDLLRYELTLDNAEPFAREGIILSFTAGPELTWETFVDLGGGELLGSTDTSISWSGGVPANGSTTLILDARVDDCVNATSTSLNFGSPISLRNSCFNPLGSIVATPVPMQTTLEADIRVLNRPGPANATLRGALQLARPGDVLEVLLTLTNPLSVSQDVDYLQTLFTGLDPAMDPPFVPPLNAGATWDAVNRQIGWSGTLAAGQSTSLRFDLQLTPEAGCATTLGGLLTANGTCQVSNGLSVGIVPEPPQAEHLVGSAFGEVWTFVPGVDTEPQTQVCFVSEFTTGISRRENGDVWIGGLPTFGYNAQTLDVFDLTGFDPLIAGFQSPQDVEFIPGTDELMLIGRDPSIGRVAVVQFDPTTQTTTELYRDVVPDLFQIQQPDVDDQGRLIAISSFDNRLIRIDPASPGSFTELSDPVIPTPFAFAVAPDGDYVVQSGFAGGVSPLAEVDAATDTYTELLPNTFALGIQPTDQGTTVGANDAIYFVSPSGRLIQRLNTGRAPRRLTCSTTTSPRRARSSTSNTFPD